MNRRWGGGLLFVFRGDGSRAQKLENRWNCLNSFVRGCSPLNSQERREIVSVKFSLMRLSAGFKNSWRVSTSLRARQFGRIQKESLIGEISIFKLPH